MLTSSGITLVELTIAMAISTTLVLFSAMGAATISKELGYFQQQLALHSELRLLSQSLSLQLQRAGYVARTFEEIFANGVLLPPSIEISHHPLEVENSCVLFSYDKNADGDITHEDPAELLGFRLRNKALEYRVASKSCAQGGWHDLTDASELYVTQFTISLHGEVNRAPVYKVKLALQSKASAKLSAEQHLYIRVANAI
ncbi:Prepilin peptidase dependent protein B [Alteromonas sp. 38]|uniref:hypothetical protein n=1 Tax=unclassified Alteromonas TaxID=2614992 RepID=UPI0012F1991D|nr:MULTISPECIES: hypothetical protein [unclassified Alteromonas]CAD5266252.1 Prepilin peptidase dependent protein B [Alteromonas sp. 154]VXC07088.1 Prepilin peptidase dependent protein B [Alteromonas sp. 38]